MYDEEYEDDEPDDEEYYGDEAQENPEKKSLRDQWGEMKQGIKNAPANLRAGVRNLKNNIKNAPGNLIKNIKNAPAMFKKLTVQLMLKFWDEIVKKCRDVIMRIKRIICFNPAKWLLSKAMEFLAGINPVQFVKKIIQMAIDGFIGALFSFRELFERIINSIAAIQAPILKAINAINSVAEKLDNFGKMNDGEKKTT